ncbi:hypothetical protein AB4Z54_09270 [Streptomyces sp. MCAF7]
MTPPVLALLWALVTVSALAGLVAAAPDEVRHAFHMTTRLSPYVAVLALLCAL